VLLLLRRPRGAEVFGVLTTLGWVIFVASIFLLTPQARFALNDQTPSRLFLQAAPAIILTLFMAAGARLQAWTAMSHRNP